MQTDTLEDEYEASLIAVETLYEKLEQLGETFDYYFKKTNRLLLDPMKDPAILQSLTGTMMRELEEVAKLTCAYSIMMGHSILRVKPKWDDEHFFEMCRKLIPKRLGELFMQFEKNEQVLRHGSADSILNAVAKNSIIPPSITSVIEGSRTQSVKLSLEFLLQISKNLDDAEKNYFGVSDDDLNAMFKEGFQRYKKERAESLEDYIDDVFNPSLIMRDLKRDAEQVTILKKWMGMKRHIPKLVRELREEGYLAKELFTLYEFMMKHEALKNLNQKKDKPEREPDMETSDEKIAKCIAQLMNEYDESGNWLIRQKSQWIGIYRILVDYCHFNSEYKSFVSRINKLDGALTWRVPCTYDAIQKTSGIFTQPYSNWKEEKFKGKYISVFTKNKDVADRFLFILKSNSKRKIA